MKGGGSGSVLGVLQEAHTQMSNTGSSSSTTSSSGPPHHNYGFDRVHEICIEDAIEVSTSAAAGTSELKENALCCTFCRGNMCREACKWRLRDTLGGLRER